MDSRLKFVKQENNHSWFKAEEYLAAGEAFEVLKKLGFSACEGYFQLPDNEIITFVQNNKETRVIVLSKSVGVEQITNKAEDVNHMGWKEAVEKNGYQTTFTGNRWLHTIQPGDYVVVEKKVA